MKRLFLFLFIITSLAGYAQKKKQLLKLNDLFKTDVTRVYISGFLTQNPELVSKLSIDYLESEYFTSQNNDTIIRTLWIIQEIYNQSNIVDVKENAIEILCLRANLNNIKIQSEVLKILRRGNKHYFSNQAIDSLHSYLTIDYPHLKELSLLLGFIGNNSTIIKLTKLLSEENLQARPKWHIRLALARLGQYNQIEYCIKKINKLPVNDFLIYEVIPEIIYIKQPQLIPLFLKILKENKNRCTSADPESEQKIHCGYRLIETMAAIFISYPIPVSASGDLDTNDYKTAKFIVTDWLEQNKNIEFRKDVF